jgi:hypothetical protein
MKATIGVQVQALILVRDERVVGVVRIAMKENVPSGRDPAFPRLRFRVKMDVDRMF